MRSKVFLWIIAVAVIAPAVSRAEIFCPTRYFIDVVAAPQQNIIVGPGSDSFYSKVTSKLTSTKAVCSVTPPANAKIPFTYPYQKFSNVADDGIRYYDFAWKEITDIISGIFDEPKKSTSTQVTYATTHYAGGTVPQQGMKYVFDCNLLPKLRFRVSSADGWHSTEVETAATDVIISEVESVRGKPRRFDVTCYYPYPKTVSVDFPRQTRPDNRDISTNLPKTGFYRVYDMNATLWGQVCHRDCEENLTLPSGTGAIDGASYNAAVNSCTNACKARGW